MSGSVGVGSRCGFLTPDTIIYIIGVGFTFPKPPSTTSDYGKLIHLIFRTFEDSARKNSPTN